jgi:hypothetical protein
VSLISLGGLPTALAGVVRQAPDPRDVSLPILGDITALPRSIDLRALDPRQENQRRLQCCCGEALTDVAEAAYKKAGFDVQLSALDLWRRIKRFEGTPVNDNVGVVIRNGLKVLAKEGVAADSIMPFDENRWQDEPPVTIDVEAAKHKAEFYYSCESDEASKWCLSQGFPFAAGVALPASVEAGDGFMFAGGDSPGRHAMSYWGFDDDIKIGPDVGGWLVHNSWGFWGLGGSGWAWLSYKCGPWDRWTIRRLSK